MTALCKNKEHLTITGNFRSEFLPYKFSQSHETEIYLSIYLYIYIHRERERERERDFFKDELKAVFSKSHLQNSEISCYAHISIHVCWCSMFSVSWNTAFFCKMIKCSVALFLLIHMDLIFQLFKWVGSLILTFSFIIVLSPHTKILKIFDLYSCEKFPSLYFMSLSIHQEPPRSDNDNSR